MQTGYPWADIPLPATDPGPEPQPALYFFSKKRLRDCHNTRLILERYTHSMRLAVAIFIVALGGASVPGARTETAEHPWQAAFNPPSTLVHPRFVLVSTTLDHLELEVGAIAANRHHIEASRMYSYLSLCTCMCTHAINAKGAVWDRLRRKSHSR